MIVLDPPAKHPWEPSKIVLLSGLSDPSSCALSRIQRTFLDQLSVPPEGKVYANFPYVPPQRAEQLAVPLPLASWRNLRQFLGARRSPYRERAIAHWEAISLSCDALLVVTLSCGLEILNVCLSTGVRPRGIDVVALGAVARSRPSVGHILVRGSRDFIRNPLLGADLVLPGVGHLDYLANPAVLDLVNRRARALVDVFDGSMTQAVAPMCSQPDRRVSRDERERS